MREAVLNFSGQFAFEPKIENSDNLKKKDRFIVCGMGGSHLAADLLKIWNPEFDVKIHSNYGLPPMPDNILGEHLIVLSSYSGNTEEVIDAYHKAQEKDLAMAVIAVGGELLKLAQYQNIPYIKFPDTGIQPRSASGFSFKAFLKIIGDEKAIAQVSELADTLEVEKFEEQGRNLAEKLNGFIPVVYASEENFALANNWKIKFNETGKIPAFCNRLPELNHNEMTGFDVVPQTRSLSEKFHFIFLRDDNDNPYILKRMSVVENLYRARGFNVEVLDLEKGTVFYKIFSSLILGDWTAYYLAKNYNVDPEEVPMVEEFKKMIK